MVKSKKVNTRLPVMFGMIFLLVFFFPLHEFGHWIVAMGDRAEILEVAWIPYIDETEVHPSGVTVNEYSFSSISTLVFFKLAGFIVVFVPFCSLFAYLYSKRSVWWTFAFILVMASFVGAGHDFLDVGRVLRNSTLAKGLYISSYMITIGLFIWFILKMRQTISPVNPSKTRDHKRKR